MLFNRHKSKLKCFLSWIYIIYASISHLHAEGTKEIKPQTGNHGDLRLVSAVSPGAKFASYNGPEYERLNVHICHVGEIINIGFQSRTGFRYRVKSPTGAIVIPERPMTTAPGVINTYNEAVLGPNTVAAGGYTPLTLTATQIGDYYIEIQGPANPDATWIAFFDITVTYNGQVETGRVWSKAWLMSTGSATNAYSGNMYVYTNDKVTTKINFNGIQPYEFIISANGTGTGNTGNLIQDRKSVSRNSTRPDFKIFLNPPDEDCYETGVLGEVLNQPTITGCPGNYCINLEVSAPGLVVFNLDVNGIPDIQLGTADRVLQSQVVAGKNCIPWDGKDGLGNDISSSASVQINVQYSNGLTNLPFFDAENHPNGYVVTYVRPIPTGMTANTPIPLFWDDSGINEGTAPDGKINLLGCVSGTGCHQWRNRGTNTWGNNNQCPAQTGKECPQTINTWWVVKEQTLQVAHSLYKKDIDANRRDPQKGKWNDTLVCASDAALQLNGKVTGDKGIQWTLLRGSGSFASDTARSTVYTFNPNDKNINNVTFLITSRGDTCPPVRDTMRVFFDPLKSVVIATPAKICTATASPINVSAALTNANKVSWTGGNGTFSPSRTAPTVQYTPTVQELASGSLDLIATTSDAIVSCPNTKDTVTLKMELPPIVKAPADTAFCQGSSNIKLDFNAAYSHTDSLHWFVDNSSLFTFDKDTGAAVSGTLSNLNQTVTIRVEAYKKDCPHAMDEVVVRPSTPPSITAPNDTSLCQGTLTTILKLKSQSMHTDSITWSVQGTGATLNTFQGDSVHVSLAHTVSALLKVQGHKKGCPSAADSLRITQALPPTLSGMATPTCEKDSRIVLSGNTAQTHAGDVIAWSKNQLQGMFVQDTTILSNAYIPSLQELSVGWAYLQLKHTRVAKCPAKDTLIRVRLTPFPVAEAGKDSLLCRGSNLLQKTFQNNIWSYEWRTSKDTSTPALSNAASIQLQVNSDTSLYLLVKNSLGCATLDSAKFKVFDPPVITLNPHICLAASTPISAVVTNRPPLGKYTWSRDQQLLTDTAASLTITAPGTYVYAYRHHHCVHADTLVATAPPVAKASDFIACLNTSGQLIADSIPYATYFWDGIPSTSPILPITTTLGSKQISLVIRDSYGCKDSTLVKVEGIPEPQFNLSHNNVCEGTLGKISVALIDPSIESIYQIESQWRSNNIPISPSNWKVLSFNNSGEYHLQLRIGNCVSEKKTNVLVFPKPIIDMPTEHKYCYEDAEAIRLESNSFAKYKWYSKEGLMDTSRSIEVRPLVRSTYRLTVENQYGCKDSIPVTIHVSCPPRLDVPNVITPESKDINATMNVYGAFYTDFELTIFNRWGEVIFESRDPKTVWDGTYRGEPMPIGVYPWIISYDAEYEEYKRPMKYKKQGDVTVVR